MLVFARPTGRAKMTPMTDMTIELERTEEDASLIEQISDEALEAAADMTNQAANTVMCTHLLGCAF
jgi:hypothetical protein